MLGSNISLNEERCDSVLNATPSNAMLVCSLGKLVFDTECFVSAGNPAYPVPDFVPFRGWLGDPCYL